MLLKAYTIETKVKKPHRSKIFFIQLIKMIVGFYFIVSTQKQNFTY